MIFKVFSVLSYDAHDVFNDNIDLRVITEDEIVFAGTFVTRANVDALMVGNKRSFLWIDDMVIVEDLRIETIRDIVITMVNDKFLSSAFSKIGSIKEVYGDDKSFDTLEAGEGGVSIVIEL